MLKNIITILPMADHHMNSDPILSDDEARCLSPEIEALDLTPLQLKYVYWRGLGLTPRASARRAGYAPSAIESGNGAVNKFERSPKVRRAIGIFQEDIRVRFKIDRDTVVSGLMEAINTAREQSDAASMIKGWSEMAKLTGVSEPKHTTIEVKASIENDINLVSDRDLLRLVGKDRVLTSVIDAEFTELETTP